MRAWQKWSVAVVVVALVGVGVWAFAPTSEAARVQNLSGTWLVNFFWSAAQGVPSSPDGIGAEATAEWYISMVAPFFGTFSDSQGTGGYVLHLRGKAFMIYTSGCRPVYAGSVSADETYMSGTMKCRDDTGEGTWDAFKVL